MSIKSGHIPKPKGKFYLLNTDITSIFREHSPTLEDKQYVYKANNKIKGNKPVGIGYPMSTIGLNIGEGRWNLPLSGRLAPSDANKNSFTARQICDLMDDERLPFKNHLTVNALDSAYCHPKYLHPTYEHENLVSIVRMASNRNVWGQAAQDATGNKKGAPKVYGQCYALKGISSQLTCCCQQEWREDLPTGGRAIVRVKLYKNMLVRTKKGLSMKDKPFTLAEIELLNPGTKEPISKCPLYLMVFGKQRDELSMQDIYQSYRKRFDIEHFFRFAKNNLLLQSYQTPDKEHLQSFVEVAGMSYWLLYINAKQIDAGQTGQGVHKWEKYLPTKKTQTAIATPSQAQRTALENILSFGQQPFKPKPTKSGKGRVKGDKQTPRTTYKTVKKT